MGATAQMTHRCSMERNGVGATPDDIGYGPSPAGVVPCLLWSTSGQEAVTSEKVIVVEDLRAMVPLGTDVTVQDQIHGVTDRIGRVIDSRVLGIQTVMAKKDHLELVLQIVTQ